MNEFTFGVTFYPDQWPREIWEENYRKIKETGFNTVRFGEMAWDWVEPQDNEFNWEELDLAMDLANKNGIKVVLGLATSQAPTWLVKNYPEVRPISNMGTLYPEYGPRPNICRDSDIYKTLAQRYIMNMVNRYKNHPALLAWQVDNEPTYPPLDSTTHEDFCHCEHTQKKFVDWAKKRYKTIEEANRVWGSRFWTNTFGSWDDITSPKCGIWDAGNPHIFMDWYQFKTDMIHEWLIWEKTLVERLDGKHKTGTNGFLEICPRMLDHDVLADGLDWYGWDVYPKGRKSPPSEIAYTADWWRSFTNGRNSEFFVTELQGGPNVRWGYPGYVTGREVKMWTHQMLAHGAKAILYHNWLTPIFGAEAGGFGIINPDGTPTERRQAIEEVSSVIKENNKRLEGYKPVPEYAIMYLRNSDVETFQEQGPPRIIGGQWEPLREEIGMRHSMNSIAGAHKILWNEYNPVDFLFQRHLKENTDLSQYKAIFIPNPYLFTEEWWDTLKKYVENGGVIVTESRFGAKTENGWLQKTPLMQKCLGLKRSHHEIIDSGDEPNIPDLKAKAYGYKDVVATDETVLGKFEDGNPALIELSIGKGKLIYACFSLFISCLKEENSELIKSIRKYFPKPQIKLCEGVEAVAWEKDGNKVFYVINYQAEAASVNIAGKKVTLKPYQAGIIEQAKVKA